MYSFKNKDWLHDAMKEKDYDLFIAMYLLKECNLRCPYCFNKNHIKETNNSANNSLQKRGLRQLDIHMISAHIEKINLTCCIGLSGGEPFLFPGFIDLCKLLTKKNFLKVSTNLTQNNVYDFAEEIDAHKVKIMNISLHITELERNNLVKDFISKIRYLRNKGFKTLVTYVMYPPLFKRFENDYKLFESHNICIVPKVFRGTYKSKTYPRSYSASQRKLIFKFLEKYYSNIRDLYSLMYKDSFKGRKCLTGKLSILIKPDGLIYRCWGDDRPIGSFLEGNIKTFGDARPCDHNKCGCPSEGLQYVIN